jgi:hypothetical protein
MQCCSFTFSAPYLRPDMKLTRVSYPGRHALHRTWDWLPESVNAKGISCPAAEGELQPVRQGRKEARAKVKYYAHTALRADGTPELDTAKGELLSRYFQYVAELVHWLAQPLNPPALPGLAQVVHERNCAGSLARHGSRGWNR